MLKRLFFWRKRARKLFRYFDGKKWRYGDPFALWRRIVNDSGTDLFSLMPLVDQGKEPECSQALEAIAALFGLHRWNGASGLTDGEILDVFGDFADYLGALKKSTSFGATLPPPTGSLSSISLADRDEIPKPCLDCGSTSPGPKAA